ncbi:MAG: MAPEG family protein [Kofleriaceae bacterium]|nr:MAPEG family protein [Kofleriaceae bacterium]
MSQHLILWPLLLQITLTVLMYIRLAMVKAKEIKAGNVDLVETAANQEAWPASVRLINSNLRNQFETPVLFYVLCIVLLALRAVSSTAIIVAFVWSGSRFLHAFVHTSSNNVKLRLPLFLVGVTCILILLVLSFKGLAAL